MNYPYHFSATSLEQAELFYNWIKSLPGVKDVSLNTTEIKVILENYSSDMHEKIMAMASSRHIEVLPVD